MQKQFLRVLTVYHKHRVMSILGYLPILKFAVMHHVARLVTVNVVFTLQRPQKFVSSLWSLTAASPAS